MPPHAPLVVTLTVDAPAQARFDAERRRLFPPGRTQVGAHVTLFHAIPGGELVRAHDDLAEVARRPTFPVRVADVMSLGRGAAYRLQSNDLLAVHADLRRRWAELLTPQDAQPFRPHITVQNKVTAEEARRTMAALAAAFEPVDVKATGVALWRYEGGPWSPLQTYPFSDADL